MVLLLVPGAGEPGDIEVSERDDSVADNRGLGEKGEHTEFFVASLNYYT